MSAFPGLYNYWIVIFLMMTGFYIVIARGNLIKKIVGLNIFQTAVFILYISMGKITGATAPIFVTGAEPEFGYSNPIPHVPPRRSLFSVCKGGGMGGGLSV